MKIIQCALCVAALVMTIINICWRDFLFTAIFGSLFVFQFLELVLHERDDTKIGSRGENHFDDGEDGDDDEQ